MQDSGQGGEMSNKTNVDALASAFGNSMSLDGGEQGGEPSPDTSTDNFLNVLNNLQAPPARVSASAEQLAAAEAVPQQPLPRTARQVAIFMNNNTTSVNCGGETPEGGASGVEAA